MAAWLTRIKSARVKPVHDTKLPSNSYEALTLLTQMWYSSSNHWCEQTVNSPSKTHNTKRPSLTLSV